MDLRTWTTIAGVCTALLWDLTCADDVDWEDSMRRRFQPNYSESWIHVRRKPLLSTGKIVAIVIAVIAVAAGAVWWFCFRRRRRLITTQQPMVPPPLAPVTTVAPIYGYPAPHPPVPAAMTSPVAPYPQPNYYQNQAPPYPQEGLYVGSNMGPPLAQPSTIPMPSPSAPLEPPPPYGYRANYPH